MKHAHSFILCLLCVFLSCSEETTTLKGVAAEDIDGLKVHNDIQRLEPPHWWVGFKKHTLQLLVYHSDIGSAKASLSYAGVAIAKQHQAKSKNYLFLDLDISPSANAGIVNIEFEFQDGQKLRQSYELKERNKAPEDYEGFNSSDVIYLVTPDRFANADPNNDSVEGLLETKVNRSESRSRHGGDIKGISNHIEYIHDMGFTAIWSSPLLTNNMPHSSYHGYAITDYYEIDPRFGTLQDYREFTSKATALGLKVVMDQVANHCGLEHWWMKDLPFQDWINDQEHFESHINSWNNTKVKLSNHRRTTHQDIYASKKDKKAMVDGWFVSDMPDLNQRNPFLAQYLIQNSIWWIEEFNLSGIRQDTYPYADKMFMSEWAGAIMREYPNFNIVGEEWSYNPLLISYWQDKSPKLRRYDSNLRSTMDFAMQSNVIQALNEEERWDKGLIKIYEGLANDFIYPSPEDILVFPDNHDMSRVFTQLNGDVAKAKMALGYFLAMPRTVQLYYGTEILMNDFEMPGDHGVIRSDFPGGWEGDTKNAFTGQGLSQAQRGMQVYLKKILNYRKSSKAIHEGQTIHFAPKNGLYPMFRIHEDEVVVVILNKTDAINIKTHDYSEIRLNAKVLKDVVTGELHKWDDTLSINPNGITFLTTKL